jgi:hypothetical protein
MASKDNDGWPNLLFVLMMLGAFLRWIGYEKLGNFLQHWTLPIVIAIGVVIGCVYAIFWWLPMKAVNAVIDDSPEGVQRRERWQVAVYSGLGAGFGSLVFEGQLWAGNEETFLEFLVTALVIAVATWMFFERIHELVSAEYRSQPSDLPGDRRRPAVLIIGTVLLITVLDMSLHSAMQKRVGGVKGDEAAQLGALLGLLVQLVIYVLCVGWIASSWVNGARQRAPRAAKKGAISGGVIGAVFALVAVLLFKAGKLPIPEGLASAAAQENPAAFMFGLIFAELSTWAGLGFAGGWAVDKRWGSRPTRGILIALTVLSTILAIFSYVVLRLPESLETIFMAVGWAMGLVLHGEVSDRVLELGAGAVGGTEGQTPAIVPLPPRPKPNPWLWGALMLVLGVAVYIAWRQVPKDQHKADSKPGNPAPSVVAPSPPRGGKKLGDLPLGGGTATPIGGKSLDTNISTFRDLDLFTDISIGISDSCNNGQEIHLRFFGLGSQVWPTDKTKEYVLKYGDHNTYKLSCFKGTNISYGACDAENTLSWGSGIDGTRTCSDCSFKCDADATQKARNLTCPQR